MLLLHKEAYNMMTFDKNKVYMLQVFIPGTAPVSDIIVPGAEMEKTIVETKNHYLFWKRIAIYEADTKEAVGIIKA